MLPTIGRMIHVYEPLNDQCVAGIVTAVDYGYRVPVPTVYATIFAPHGAINDTARRVTLPDQGTWHDPRDCHPRVNGMPVHPDGTVDDATRPGYRIPGDAQGDHFRYPDALGTDTAGDETSAPLGDPGRVGDG